MMSDEVPVWLIHHSSPIIHHFPALVHVDPHIHVVVDRLDVPLVEAAGIGQRAVAPAAERAGQHAMPHLRTACHRPALPADDPGAGAVVSVSRSLETFNTNIGLLHAANRTKSRNPSPLTSTGTTGIL